MAQNSADNQLSNWQLKFGYWYVTNKLKLKKALVISLIVLNVGLFGYSIIMGIILLLQLDTHQQIQDSLGSDLIDYNYFHEQNKPKEIVMASLDILPTTGGRYDIVAKVKNPNTRWYVENIVFQFVSASEIAYQGESFILPFEEKNLIAFGVDKPIKLGNLTLNIDDISWQRVSNYEEFAESRLDFRVSDIEFITSRSSGLSSRLPVSQSRFMVTNNSAYNFWQVGFYVLLYSGNQLVGINYTTIDQFLSEQTREVSINWFESLPSVTRTQVVPELNILDENAYITY